MIAIRDFSNGGVRRSATESLARLGRDRSDIVFLHNPDGLCGSRLASAWGPLREMRERGVAGAIGISGNDAHSLAAMVFELDPDIVLLAGRYTLLDQSALDDLLPLALGRRVSVVLGGIFNAGILADPAGVDRFDYRPARADERERARRIESIARRHDVPIAAAAIQFAAAHPAVTSILVGVRSEQELVADVAMARISIPSSFWEALSDAGLDPTGRPRPIGRLYSGRDSELRLLRVPRTSTIRRVDPVGRTYQIGALAARTHLSLRTLRYWEEVGLIAPTARTTGGFRLFTEADVQRVELIKRMKPIDLTLDELRVMVEDRDVLADPASPPPDREAALARTEALIGRIRLRCEILRERVEDAELAALDLERLVAGGDQIG